MSEAGSAHAAPEPEMSVKPSHWPWSGRVRRYIYIDFAVYVALLVIFCVTTLVANSGSAHDAYNVVQSIQTTLLQEVCCCDSVKAA